ncbi:MAG: ADP-ribosylglycohydrolase [Rhodocyclales bacterium GWA2_65_19]|nr:MAG: ADP-ribosylglycohydrolase [Rhodocyclales bacterium GWA2_65_19]
METIERFRGTLLGLACGDAVGTTVEFKSRGSFLPVTDMVGGGPFRLKPGEWTDDTSMALCLATSLVECGRFDPADQMQRYCRWMESGYLASNGRCFDIGRTVSQALHGFRRTGEPYSGSTDPNSAGNGCLMRLAPVPMFFFSDREAAIAMSGESSRTTHGAQECIEASRLFGAMLTSAFSGFSKEDILLGHGVEVVGSARLQRVAEGNYRVAAEDEIQGSGYVVESLEAALWCFLQTDNFRDAVLRATNLGRDADTTAAICGQLVGAFYGESGIPHEWRERLVMASEIRALAGMLHACSQGGEKA